MVQLIYLCIEFFVKYSVSFVGPVFMVHIWCDMVNVASLLGPDKVDLQFTFNKLH